MLTTSDDGCKTTVPRINGKEAYSEDQSVTCCKVAQFGLSIGNLQLGRENSHLSVPFFYFLRYELWLITLVQQHGLSTSTSHNFECYQSLTISFFITQQKIILYLELLEYNRPRLLHYPQVFHHLSKIFHRSFHRSNNNLFSNTQKT